MCCVPEGLGTCQPAPAVRMVGGRGQFRRWGDESRGRETERLETDTDRERGEKRRLIGKKEGEEGGDNK